MNGVISFTLSQNRISPEGDTLGTTALANWLDSDIQGSKTQIDFWIREFASVKDGIRQSGCLGSGNSFSVMATESLVLIQCDYADSEQVVVATEQMNLVLQAYMRFLNDGDCRPLPFEYIAEGASAEHIYEELGGKFGGV